MMKSKVCLILCLFISLAVVVQAKSSCIDTDNGDNFLQKGRVYDAVYKKGIEDYCYPSNNNLLIEGRCVNGEYGIAYKYCEEVIYEGKSIYNGEAGHYTCLDGACKPKPFCKDTDNGKDFFNKGTVYSDKYLDGKEDYCYTFSSGINYLMEGVCGTNGYRYVQKNCAELGKYICEKGSCVKSYPKVNDDYTPTEYNQVGLDQKGNQLCSENDGGKNDNNKGILISPNGKAFIDFCSVGPAGSSGAGIWTSKSDYLYEYYCFEDKHKSGGSEIIKCEYGCVNGECLFPNIWGCEKGTGSGTDQPCKQIPMGFAMSPGVYIKSCSNNYAYDEKNWQNYDYLTYLNQENVVIYEDGSVKTFKNSCGNINFNNDNPSDAVLHSECWKNNKGVIQLDNSLSNIHICPEINGYVSTCVDGMCVPQKKPDAGQLKVGCFMQWVNGLAKLVYQQYVFTYSKYPSYGSWELDKEVSGCLLANQVCVTEFGTSPSWNVGGWCKAK